ncbi:unnamed protein product [Cuscuta europaea]|uniref:Uncharacterized protein n=1 Tax=Cuscuta europaea TaxID=41803 RepID=A0A9P0YPX5_CUSEU|nr:unnamed protein product [Cuscuta europaea]
MLAGIQQLNLNQTAMNTRIEDLYSAYQRVEDDQRRAFGPMYAYFDQQGYFSHMPTPVQHATWYDPSHWGNFGGSSSGGGGQAGGDGVDRDFGGGDGGYGGSSDTNDEEYPYTGDFHDSYYGQGGFFDGGDAGGH